MNKIALLLFAALFLQSCDDGDVIVRTFNFDGAPLQLCGQTGSYVFFRTNDGVNESIALKTNAPETVFFNSDVFDLTNTVTTVSLNGDTNTVVYRSFDDAVPATYFCSNIPPTAPNVVAQYTGASGTAVITTVLVGDDGDGLDIEPNADTDADGLPDPIDFDDDGDNVPTALELGDDPNNPLDTDGDGIADYLDEDDDNDGVPTRNEDANGNLNPRDDVTDTQIGPDYLNPKISTAFPINKYREHSFSVRSDVSVTLNNLVLTNGDETIVEETFGFGSLEGVLTQQVTHTPSWR